MSNNKFIELAGEKPGIWCPAYQRTKDRTICGEKRCRYYQNQHLTPVSRTGDDSPDFDDNLDALSIKRPSILSGRELFVIISEKSPYHCIRYDEPSKYISLPWETQ
jgi:hypothetical protein